MTQGGISWIKPFVKRISGVKTRVASLLTKNAKCLLLLKNFAALAITILTSVLPWDFTILDSENVGIITSAVSR